MMRLLLPILLILSTAAPSALAAKKLKTLHGASPLSDDLNRDKNQVRILFFGSPT